MASEDLFEKTLSDKQMDVKEPLPRREKPPFFRKIPPVSLRDTSIISIASGILLSEHGSTRVFEDHEIIEVHAVISKVELGNRVFAQYTTSGKAIIQQQSTRGCSPAAVSMLIKDNGGIVNTSTLKNGSLWNHQKRFTTLIEAGLIPIERKVDLSSHQSKLESLKACLLKYGTAIVSFGGHVVLVDHISDCLSRVRLRDPYHGWEITVKANAFTLILKESVIIQILK